MASWVIRMFVAAVLCIIACLAAGGCGPSVGHIYDVSFGQVYCANGFLTDCGVHLYNCADGHEYFCLQNVRERESQ